MKVPTYWFCFTLSFGLLALAPVWYFRIGRWPEKSLHMLAVAYDHHAFDANWRLWAFAGHIILATAIAAALTLAIHNFFIPNQTSSTASLKFWFTMTTLIAVFFALWKSLDVSMQWAGISAIPLLGYGLSSSVIALIDAYKAPRSSREQAG